MRIFHLEAGGVRELDSLPTQALAQGFVWVACAQQTAQQQLPQLQGMLQAFTGTQLVDLHVSDLLNPQLPSHYDYTSQYDLLVFRRLASAAAHTANSTNAPPEAPRKHRGPPVLRRIDTSPVGFAVFDQVLLTVHPRDCLIRDTYAARLLSTATAFNSNSETSSNGRSGTTNLTGRLPTGTADLMLRLVNLMVDGYLDLRRELTRQLDHWQTELLRPHTRFVNWSALLDTRLALHHLDEICEDQRSAVQDWIDALQTWPAPNTAAELRERDLLQVRSRDVLEHIERVVHHVRRLEQSTETTVQMHFSVQSNRTNDIMRTLTALTAVFLPLNLIAGIFGMNFEFLPLIHWQNGFWLALGTMGMMALALIVFFWRKRYLAHTPSDTSP